MKTLQMHSMLAVAAFLVVPSVPMTATADGGVTVGIGHSWSKSFGRTPFLRNPTVTVDKPNIASVSWSGGESGTLTITGVEEGDAVVTITGQVRVTELGAGGTRVTGTEDVSATIPVKVIAADEYWKLVILHVKQRMSIKFPQGMKMGAKAPSNSNPSVVIVRRNSSKQLTLTGKKEGESTLRFKLIIEKDGKEKEVPATIWVRVIAGKPRVRRIRMGWDALPVGEIIILKPAEGRPVRPKPKPKTTTKPKKDRRVGLADWPGTEGVNCTFTPSGRNYGDIGDLTIENDTDKPVSVTIPPCMLLESSDPAVQDLYMADVPTETPCAGAKDIGKSVNIPPGGWHVTQHVPGFCPDYEKNPPTKGDENVLTCKEPDEKSKVLLETIACAKKLDVGSLKLDVFEEDKAREMVTQGSLWMVDSEVDEVEGNEVTDAALSSRFYQTFAESAKESLGKMSAEDRKKAEDLVKDDIRAIVAATSFIAKQGQEAAAATSPKTCTRKQNPGRVTNNSEARSFDPSDTARLNSIINNMPNFLYNMDMVFLRVDKWAFDPENPGGYQSGGMIVLTDKFFSMTSAQQEATLRHELGHQWHEQNLKLVQDFLKIGWNVEEGKTYRYEDLKGTGALGSSDSCPSRKTDSTFPRRPGDNTNPPYSATNPLEDFGVSLELYLTNPESLKAQSPERYEWMKNNIPKNAPAPQPAGK